MTRTALVLAACCAALAPATAVGGVEFTAGATLSTSAASGMAVADLDGDGHLDVVHSTSTVDPATVFRGAGDGTFDGGTPIAGTGPGGLVRVVDANGDALPDLVIANQNAGLARVLTNGSTPGSIAFGVVNVSAAVGSQVYGVDMADANGDGRTDLLIGGLSSVALALRNSDGTFASPVSVSAQPGLSVHLADVAGTAAPDLVQITTLSASPAELRVAPGNGDGTFGTVQTLSVPGSGGLSVLADPDGDGDRDILLPQLAVGSTSMRVLRNDGGTFTLGPVVAGLSARPWTVDLADVDGDGTDDAVIASSTGSASWVKGTGDAAMFGTVSVISLPSPTAPYAAAGDLDGDLRPDLVLTRTVTGTTIARNTSTVAGTGALASPFGAVDAGTTLDRTATLTNTGFSRLRPGPATLTGTGAAHFTVTATTCNGVTLRTGESCTATVRFAPTAGGTHSAQVSWATALPAAVGMAISGTGTEGTLSAPAAADAGTLAAGAQGTAAVTVTNTGPVFVTALPAAEVQGAGWSIAQDGCAGRTITALGTCEVRLAVVAAAGANPGTLTIPGRGISVALTAAGTAPATPVPATPAPTTPGTAPRSAVRPRIVGPRTPRVGATLRAAHGFTGSPAPTTDVRWERCAPNGRTCVRAGSGPRHRVRPADRGHRLRIRVTATNTAGTVAVTSSLTSVIAVPRA